MQSIPPVISSSHLQDIEEEEYFEVDGGVKEQAQVPTASSANDVTFIDNVPRKNSQAEMPRPTSVTIPNYSLDIPDPLHPDILSEASTVESPPPKQESIEDLGLLPPLPTSSEFDLAANLNKAPPTPLINQQQVAVGTPLISANPSPMPLTIMNVENNSSVNPSVDIQLLPDPLEINDAGSVIMHKINANVDANANGNANVYTSPDETALMKNNHSIGNLNDDQDEVSRHRLSMVYFTANDNELTNMINSGTADVNMDPNLDADTNTNANKKSTVHNTDVTGLNTAFNLSKALEMTPSTPITADRGLMLSIASSSPSNTPITVPNTNDSTVTAIQSKPRKSIGVASPVISQLSSKFNIKTKPPPTVSAVKRSSSLTHSFNSGGRNYSYGSHPYDHSDRMSAMPRKFSFEGSLSNSSSSNSNSNNNNNTNLKQSFQTTPNSGNIMASLNQDIFGGGIVTIPPGSNNIYTPNNNTTTTTTAATPASTALAGLAIPNMFPLTSSAEHSPIDTQPKRAPFLKRMSSSLMRRTSLKSERRRSEEVQAHANSQVYSPSDIPISPSLVTNTQQTPTHSFIGQFSPPVSRHGSLVKRSASLGSKVRNGIGRILSNGSSAVKKFTGTPSSGGATANTVGPTSVSPYATPRTTATETFGSPFSFTSSITTSPPLNNSTAIAKKNVKYNSRRQQSPSITVGVSGTTNSIQQPQMSTQGVRRSGSLPRTRSKGRTHHRHNSSKEIELNLTLLDSSTKFPEIFVTDSLKNEPIEKIIEQSKLSFLPATKQERHHSRDHSSRKSTSTTTSSTPSVSRVNSTINTASINSKVPDRVDNMSTISSNAVKKNSITTATSVVTAGTATATAAAVSTPSDPEATEKLSIREYTALLKKLKIKDIQKYDILIRNFKESGWSSPHDIKIISEKRAKLSKLWNDKIAFYQNLI